MSFVGNVLYNFAHTSNSITVQMRARPSLTAPINTAVPANTGTEEPALVHTLQSTHGSDVLSSVVGQHSHRFPAVCFSTIYYIQPPIHF